MSKFLVAIALGGILVGANWVGALPSQSDTQGAGHDMKEAGRSTKRAAKKTVRKSKRETKKAANKSAAEVEKGAHKAKRKTNPNPQ